MKSVSKNDDLPSKVRQMRRLLKSEGILGAIKGLRRYVYHQYAAPLSDRFFVRKGARKVTVEGMNVRLLISSLEEARTIRYARQGERVLLKDLISELREDDVFFDVGANMGLFSCFVSQRVVEGEVIAFEPFPPNVEVLRRNLSQIGSNWTIMETALSNSGGVVPFTGRNSDSTQVTGTAGFETDKGEAMIEVATERGDALVSGDDVPKPTVIKIDVEGAESLVIEGMKESLASEQCRLLYCEVHPSSDEDPSIDDFGSSESELRELIHELGFDIEVIEQRERTYHLKAVKRNN